MTARRAAPPVKRSQPVALYPRPTELGRGCGRTASIPLRCPWDTLHAGRAWRPTLDGLAASSQALLDRLSTGDLLRALVDKRTESLMSLWTATTVFAQSPETANRITSERLLDKWYFGKAGCLSWLQSSSAAECLRKSTKTRPCDSSRCQADQHRASRSTQSSGTGLCEQGGGLGQEGDPRSLAPCTGRRWSAVRCVPLSRPAGPHPRLAVRLRRPESGAHVLPNAVREVTWGRCRKRATSSAASGGVPQQEAARLPSP